MLFVDASTLILAAKTGLLDLFIEASRERLAISAGVENEATRKNSLDALLIKQRIKEKKITVKKVKSKGMAKKIQHDFHMHQGEAETIALCIENKERAIATDDYNAMKACAVLNIEYVTILGILFRVYKDKKLTKNEAKLKLEALEKYGRYSKEIMEDFAKRLEG